MTFEGLLLELVVLQKVLKAENEKNGLMNEDITLGKVLYSALVGIQKSDLLNISDSDFAKHIQKVQQREREFETTIEDIVLQANAIKQEYLQNKLNENKIFDDYEQEYQKELERKERRREYYENLENEKYKDEEEYNYDRENDSFSEEDGYSIVG